MYIAEEEELIGCSAHGYSTDDKTSSGGYRIRMDWILALGRTSLDQGDLRTALKYFSMAAEVDNRNLAVNYYLSLTRRLIKKRRQVIGNYEE